MLIKRTYQTKETLGNALVVDGMTTMFVFNTIELPWLDNQHMISCIPEGTYAIHKITSVKMGKCFEIQNVPNREGVLIHRGNYATGPKVDTEGCILVGDGFADINKDGNLDIINSTLTLKKLITLLPNEFNLTITKDEMAT